MTRLVTGLLLWFVGLPLAVVAARESSVARIAVLVLLSHLIVNLVMRHVGHVRYRRWAGAQPWTDQDTLPAAASFAAGEGQDAVLLVHGFCDAAFVWRRQADRLASAGFHVKAIQLAGFGVRGLPDRTPSAWQQQLTDSISDLAATHRRVFVMAHSFGCSLALDAAYRHGRYGLAPIAGLVLFAPLIRPLPANRWGIGFKVQHALHCVLLPLPIYLPSMFREVVKGEDDPDFTYRRDAFMRITHLESLMRVVNRLQRIDRAYVNVPTRVFLAGDDRLVDSEATRRWFATAPAPCAFSVVPKAKHALPTAAGWQRTCDAAIEFMH